MAVNRAIMGRPEQAATPATLADGTVTLAGAAVLSVDQPNPAKD
ncbi:MAG TPA: hypothetical protein VFU35_08910 [Jatrophihabitans sp.]|nr:hypothetical protein [Jatrophihabitans sp.]